MNGLTLLALLSLLNLFTIEAEEPASLGRLRAFCAKLKLSVQTALPQIDLKKPEIVAQRASFEKADQTFFESKISCANYTYVWEKYNGSMAVTLYDSEEEAKIWMTRIVNHFPIHPPFRDVSGLGDEAVCFSDPSKAHSPGSLVFRAGRVIVEITAVNRSRNMALGHLVSVQLLKEGVVNNSPTPRAESRAVSRF